jgi:hypothetical protein
MIPSLEKRTFQIRQVSKKLQIARQQSEITIHQAFLLHVTADSLINAPVIAINEVSVSQIQRHLIKGNG